MKSLSDTNENLYVLCPSEIIRRKYKWEQQKEASHKLQLRVGKYMFTFLRSMESIWIGFWNTKLKN